MPAELSLALRTGVGRRQRMPESAGAAHPEEANGDSRGKGLNKRPTGLIIVASSGPETAFFAFLQGRVFAVLGGIAGPVKASGS